MTGRVARSILSGSGERRLDVDAPAPAEGRAETGGILASRAPGPHANFFLGDRGLAQLLLGTHRRPSRFGLDTGTEAAGMPIWAEG
jgi:hypothetical protein